ncbi:hypothetical protein G6F59_015642 [Rhizopus arrhizus]|nr:hypothetical protein G6F59_015642 [Rhizopus arrhizus]
MRPARCLSFEAGPLARGSSGLNSEHRVQRFERAGQREGRRVLRQSSGYRRITVFPSRSASDSKASPDASMPSKPVSTSCGTWNGRQVLPWSRVVK